MGDTEDTLPSIDELTGPDRDPGDVLEQTRHLLGIGARRVLYGDPDRPDVHGLAQELFGEELR